MAKVNNTLAAPNKPGDTLRKYVEDMMKGGAIAKALPKVITPERFTRMTLSAISNSADLQSCTPTSFLAAMMQAAQLGLEPNTPLGQAYLIPYRNHGRMECQFQTGYQGLIDLCYRTNQYKRITAEIVHENDVFEYELGLDPKLVHKPAMKNRGAAVAYYATYTLTNGGQSFAVMSKDEMEEFRKQYVKASGERTPWSTSFDSMAKKTVLKQLLKLAPKTADISVALGADETIKHEVAEDMSTVPADVITIDTETGEVIQDNTEAIEMSTVGEVDPFEGSDSLL